MLPDKKRAQRLDDRLRELGFHARASGIYKTAASAVAAPTNTIAQKSRPKSPREGGEPEKTDKKRRGRGGSAADGTPLTQEEKQASMAKMVEACRKKRPGPAGGTRGAEQR